MLCFGRKTKKKHVKIISEQKKQPDGKKNGNDAPKTRGR